MTSSRRTSVTDPNGKVTTYAYDDADRLLSVTEKYPVPSTQFPVSLLGIGFRTSGSATTILNRRTSLTRPNGVVTNYSYDNLSRLLSVLHQASGTTTIDGAGYTYDDAGNRTSKTNYLNSTVENYAYDAIYQLQQVTQGTNTTENYTYDKVGNAMLHDETGGPTSAKRRQIWGTRPPSAGMRKGEDKSSPF